MKCINGARTCLFYNIHQQHHQHYHHLPNSKTHSWPQPQRCFHANTQTTQALLLSDLAVLAADINIIAQPKGDMNVFLQTGGLMLSAYLLANFVVPNIVLKQLNEAKEPESSKSTVDAETSNEQQQTPKKTKNRD